MKWSAVGKGDFEAYKRVVDAYFDFSEKDGTAGRGSVEFHCSVVLTQVRGRSFSGQRGKKAIGYEFFQHCLNLSIFHKYSLFHFYLDRRHSDDAEAKSHDQKLRKKLCSLLRHKDDPRVYAARKVNSRHSHEVQGLQLADLLIGAVAFRLNRHYDSDQANPDKKLLCEHILRRGGLWDYINVERSTFREKRTGRFQLWQQRRLEAINNPPKPRQKVSAPHPSHCG
jgi:hypothetical protein